MIPGCYEVVSDNDSHDGFLNYHSQVQVESNLILYSVPFFGLFAQKVNFLTFEFFLICIFLKVLFDHKQDGEGAIPRSRLEQKLLVYTKKGCKISYREMSAAETLIRF